MRFLRHCDIKQFLFAQVCALAALGIILKAFDSGIPALSLAPFALAGVAILIFFPGSIPYIYFISFFWGRYLVDKGHMALVVNDIAFVMLVFAYIAPVVFRRRPLLGMHRISRPVLVPLLVMYLWAFVSFLSNFYDYEGKYLFLTLWYLGRFSELLAVYLIFSDTRISINLEKTISLCLVLLLVQFPVAVYQLVWGSGAHFELGRMSVVGTFTSHHVMLGTVLLFGLAFCFYRYLTTRSLTARMFYIAIALIYCITMLISGSRSSLLGVAISVTVFILMHFKFKTSHIIYLVLLGCTGVLLALFSPLKNILAMTFSNQDFNTAIDSSTILRLFIWRETIGHFLSSDLWHKLTGVGIGVYPSIKYGMVLVSGESTASGAHNNILHVLAELGLVGLIAFILFLAGTFRELMARMHTSPLAYAYFFLTIALTGSFMTQESFWFQRPLHMLWLLYMFFLAFILRSDPAADGDATHHVLNRGIP